MFDWLGNLIGGLFGKSTDGVVSGLFSTFANSLAGTPKSQSLMRPQSILGGTEKRREYGNDNPAPGRTGMTSAAPYDEIQQRWERRMARIMNRDSQ